MVKIKSTQEGFQSKLSSVRMGGNKSNKQLSEIENNMDFYKSWEENIKFYNGCFKAVYDSKHGKGLKILTLKQANASNITHNYCTSKSRNTSQKLPNEIR